MDEASEGAVHAGGGIVLAGDRPALANRDRDRTAAEDRHGLHDLAHHLWDVKARLP